MANEGRSSVIDDAFRNHRDLRNRIHEALNLSPLFSEISLLVADLQKAQSQPQAQSQSQPQSQFQPQPQKKRKHDGNDDDGGNGGNGAAYPSASNGSAKSASAANALLQSGTPYFSAGEISFSIPQRKKLRLEFVRDAGVRAVTGTGMGMGKGGGDYAFGIGWADIEQIFCLTVPEKATRQRNYVIIPKGGDGVTTSTDDGATNGAEPIVWTVPETAPKTVTLGAGVDAGSGADGDANTTADDETYVSVISRAIKEGWGRRREVVTPRKEEFVSALTESHRKGEPAWHVKAFRGSKEGYLFFLPPGILWAFKKPILFFPLTAISSVSYTSILQRTFNLVITVTRVNSNNTNNNDASTAARVPSASTTTTETEFEFSMLDQADYTGIDGFIKRHALNDASMAELRRAKLLNINGPPGGGADADMNDDGGGGDGGSGVGGANGSVAMDGETELERAQRMIEDAEDEEEEDYEPEGSDEEGSESSSGSGSDEEVGEDEDAEEEEDENENENDQGKKANG